jgi:hypothetical protein
VSLYLGPGWLPVNRKQEQDMATKSLGPTFRLDKSSGKITKRPPRVAAGQKRNKIAKATREAKAWKAKSK